MKSKSFEIAAIVDRSGSMGTVAEESISGYNQFLQDQKALEGEAKWTLVLFDHQYLCPLDGVPITEAQPLNAETYKPRGFTALLDAIGRTIKTIGERLSAMPEAERPAKVIVAILTDGLENASNEYSKATVARMIEEQQSKYAWEFVFLGANMDAVAEAAALNIPAANAMSFQATREGTQTAYDSMSRMVTHLRV